MRRSRGSACCTPRTSCIIGQSLSRLIVACIRAIETSQGVAGEVSSALEAMLSDSEVAASRQATASKSSAAELRRQLEESGTEVRTCPGDLVSTSVRFYSRMYAYDPHADEMCVFVLSHLLWPVVILAPHGARQRRGCFEMLPRQQCQLQT